MTTKNQGIGTFRGYLNETVSMTVSDWDADEIVDFVKSEWSDISNGGSTNFSKGRLGGEGFLVGKFFLAADKTEADNNIMSNDTLRLMLTISDEGVIAIENSSYLVNPTKSFYVYSSHKVKLRKTRFKDMKKLKTSITKMFSTVIGEGKKLLKNGDFAVHDGKVAMDTLKKRLK